MQLNQWFGIFHNKLELLWNIKMEPNYFKSGSGKSYEQYGQSSNVKGITRDQYRKAQLYLKNDLLFDIKLIVECHLSNQNKIEKLEKIEKKILSKLNKIDIGNNHLEDLQFKLSLLEIDLKYKEQEYQKTWNSFLENPVKHKLDLNKVRKERDSFIEQKRSLTTEMIYFQDKPPMDPVNKALKEVRNSITQLKIQKQPSTSEYKPSYGQSTYEEPIYEQPSYMKITIEQFYQAHEDIYSLTIRGINSILSGNISNSNKIEKLEEIEHKFVNGLEVIEDFSKKRKQILQKIDIIEDKISNGVDSLETLKSLQDHRQELKDQITFEVGTSEIKAANSALLEVREAITKLRLSKEEAKPTQQQPMPKQPVQQTHPQSYVQHVKTQEERIINLDKAHFLLDERLIKVLSDNPTDSTKSLNLLIDLQENQIKDFQNKFQNESTSKAYANSLNDLKNTHKVRLEAIKYALNSMEGINLLKSNEINILIKNPERTLKSFHMELIDSTSISQLPKSKDLGLILVENFVKRMELHQKEIMEFPKEPENFTIPKNAIKLIEAYDKYIIAKSKNDYASLFGLQEGYTEEDVNKAFNKLAVKIHPDKNTDYPKEAEILFKFFQGLATFLINMQRKD